MRVALYGESAFAYYLVAGDAPSAVAPPSVLDKSCYPTQATLDYVRERMPYLTRPVHCLVPKWERCSLDDVHLHGSSYPYRSGSFFAHRSWRYCSVSRIMLSSAGPEPRSSPVDSSGMLSVRDFRPRPLGAVGAYGADPVDKPSTHRRLSRALPRSRWPYTRAGGSAVCLR